ncbi:MAG: hypothetical protein M3O15_09705, partial [Acidobacteriota bacterium]|nr:hypothetical protein [Acidobacteriota bacterium]
MNEQIYLIEPDGRRLTRLTDGGKATNRLEGWSHDGKLLALGSNREEPTAVDAYVVDLLGGSWRRAAAGRGNRSLTDISRDGRWAISYRSE